MTTPSLLIIPDLLSMLWPSPVWKYDPYSPFVRPSTGPFCLFLWGGGSSFWTGPSSVTYLSVWGGGHPLTWPAVELVQVALQTRVETLPSLVLRTWSVTTLTIRSHWAIGTSQTQWRPEMRELHILKLTVYDAFSFTTNRLSPFSATETMFLAKIALSWVHTKRKRQQKWNFSLIFVAYSFIFLYCSLIFSALIPTFAWCG